MIKKNRTTKKKETEVERRKKSWIAHQGLRRCLARERTRKQKIRRHTERHSHFFCFHEDTLRHTERTRRTETAFCPCADREQNRKNAERKKSFDPFRPPFFLFGFCVWDLLRTFALAFFSSFHGRRRQHRLFLLLYHVPFACVRVSDPT